MEGDDQETREKRNKERDIANDHLDWFSFENKWYLDFIIFLVFLV